MRISWVLALGFAWAVGLAATESAAPGKPLTEEQTDALLDDILARARTITRVQADMILRKQGGVFQTDQVAYETLKLEAPHYLWLQNRGASEKRLPADQCALLILDGTYAWELERPWEGETTRRAERRKLELKDGGASPTGVAGVLSQVILGGEDVRTAGEMRERFAIVARLQETGGPKGGPTHYFRLKPKEDDKVIELWVRPGRTLPWRVRTEEHTRVAGPAAALPNAPKFRTRSEERLLRNVETNLTGLEPFPVETFLFPLADTIRVEDADNELKAVEPARLRRDLAAVRKRILAERAAAAAPDGDARAGKGGESALER